VLISTANAANPQRSRYRVSQQFPAPTSRAIPRGIRAASRSNAWNVRCRMSHIAWCRNGSNGRLRSSWPHPSADRILRYNSRNGCTSANSVSRIIWSTPFISRSTNPQAQGGRTGSGCPQFGHTSSWISDGLSPACLRTVICSSSPLKSLTEPAELSYYGVVPCWDSPAARMYSGESRTCGGVNHINSHQSTSFPRFGIRTCFVSQTAYIVPLG